MVGHKDRGSTLPGHSCTTPLTTPSVGLSRITTSSRAMASGGVSMEGDGGGLDGSLGGEVSMDGGGGGVDGSLGGVVRGRGRRGGIEGSLGGCPWTRTTRGWGQRGVGRKSGDRGNETRTNKGSAGESRT